MTTHIQQNDLFSTPASRQLPRPSHVALIAGALWAALFIVSSTPLLVAGGLWMLGMALTLIGYALLSYRRFKTGAWDIAIAGQALGLLGAALLFGATLLG